MSGQIPATLIPGDGIGPEITEAVTSVLDALGSPFEWDIQHGGMAGIEKGGDPLPGSLIDSIRRTRLARLPLRERPIARGIRALRQLAAGENHGAGRAL
jgi:isocitrate dehydrogenase (NAD+)